MTDLTFLILLPGAAAIALAAFFYLRREAPAYGRGGLLALRLAVLSLVALLLWNPRVPGEDPATAPQGRAAWVLLDPDLSLTIPGDDGAPLWDRAVGEATARADAGARIALATPGDRGPEGTDPETLRLRSPAHPPGDLREGVLRLAEAGADSIVLLSSFRTPAALLETLGRETPVPLRLRRLGSEVRNAGVAELALPARAPADAVLEGRVVLFGEGGEPGDSVEVEIRAGEELVRTLRVALPAPGEAVPVPLTLPPPPDTGLVRYSARVRLEADAFAADDERARWVRVGEAEGGILLVSLRPDWEPRVLLPTLQAVTGMEGDGFLSVGEDRFLVLGATADEVRSVDADAFRDRIPRAGLVVLHGAGPGAPSWLRNAVLDHPRVLHLPAGPEGAGLAGAATGSPVSGVWEPDPRLPPSPVLPFLAGLELGGLPPLSTLLPVEGDPPGTTALAVRGPGAAEGSPAVLLLEEEGARRVLVLAAGFWRWGSRPGPARETYRGLWGGAASWLLGAPDVAGAAAVRPQDVVQPRGIPLRWEVASGARGGVLTLVPGEERADEDPREGVVPAFEGPLAPEGEEPVALTPAMEPGIYRFEVRDPEADPDAPPLAAGVVEVERWAPSLRLPPLEVDGTGILPAEGRAPEPAAAGRFVRTHPLPYLLIVLFLAAEWLGRRRLGFR